MRTRKTNGVSIHPSYQSNGKVLSITGEGSKKKPTKGAFGNKNKNKKKQNNA